MENGSSFEKNMREKLFGYTEEPDPRVWDHVLREIEKPQSISEIIFPWAGPGMDLVVAILLIFQINIPSLNNTKPLMAKINSVYPKNEIGSAVSEKILKQNFYTNAGNQFSKNSIPENIAELDGFNRKRDGIASSLGLEQNKFERENSEVVKSNDAFLLNEKTSETNLLTSLPVETETPTSLLLSQDLLRHEYEPTQMGTEITSASEGIIRVGLAPIDREAKKSVKEIKGKGLSIVCMSPSELNILPEDYSSGNPFRAEASKKWLLDLWYAPTLGFSEIKSRKPDVKAAYLAIRDSSESPVYFGSFGLALGRKMNDLLFVSAGLQYGARNENFSGVYQWDVSEIEVDTIIHGKIIGSHLPKVVTVEYDTVINTSRKSKLLNHQVKFQTWEVPVKAGLRFDKENIVFSLQAGLIASWRTRVSGTVLDPVLMEEILVQPGIERQFLLSGTLSAGVEWKLGQHLSIIAEPQYRYFFQSPYSDSFALNLQWQSLALLSGLRVRF
jgi:hypothetical protein